MKLDPDQLRNIAKRLRYETRFLGGYDSRGDNDYVVIDALERTARAFENEAEGTSMKDEDL